MVEASRHTEPEVLPRTGWVMPGTFVMIEDALDRLSAPLRTEVLEKPNKRVEADKETPRTSQRITCSSKNCYSNGSLFIAQRTTVLRSSRPKAASASMPERATVSTPSGRRKPAMALSRLDFPQPEGPSISSLRPRPRS